jgi:Domain of unknown function (DUF5667)
MPDDTRAGENSGRESELAELLDACLRAEQNEPGAAARLVEAAPADLRDELGELVHVAKVLERGLTPQPTDTFPRQVGERLHSRIGTARPPRRHLRWWQLAAASLVVLSLVVYGFTTAAAESLPGQPLYGIKRATEFVALERVRDDAGRALVLVDQAGIRLDECSQLVHAGQTDAAMLAAEQYVATLREATALILAARPAPDQQARDQFALAVGGQQARLELLTGSAPESLRPGLEAASKAAASALEQDRQVNRAASPAPGPTTSQSAPRTRPSAPPSLGPTNNPALGTEAPSPPPGASPPAQRASPSIVVSPQPGQP